MKLRVGDWMYYKRDKTIYALTKKDGSFMIGYPLNCEFPYENAFSDSYSREYWLHIPKNKITSFKLEQL